jgi:hypothetical protein
VLRARDELAEVATISKHDMARRRQTRGSEQSLRRDLVHRDRGAEHARADVRQVGQLEQPLHGAVLAVRSVQQRQHDVDVERRARR